MNKEEFLNALRKRLNVLEDSEIEDIISEYEGYIEEKVNVGCTEEEAVKELGDMDEIVSDLLAAYKVKSEPTESGLNKFINKISNAIDNFMDSLNDKSAKDIIRILIEIIIVLFLICILKIPFAMIRDLGSSIFEELANPVGAIFSGLWRFIIEFSYVIVAIIFFFKMFEKRYFKNVSRRLVEDVEEEIETTKEKKKDSSEKSKNKTGKKTTSNEEKQEKKIVVERVKEHTFVDTLTDICVAILKFFVIFFIIGIIFYLIGMTVAIGFMIYLIAKGVTYWGILILLVSLFMGGAFFLELSISFVFNKKIKAIPIFSKLISTIIILGIGLTISAIEISNTEIIYDNMNQESAKITREITMQEGLKLYNYDKIVIDNTLGDKIKIEVIYPEIAEDLKLDIRLDNCGTGYCLHYDIEKFKWNKKFLDKLIKNLKDKKIYTYEFKVEKVIYATEENAKKLKTNKYQYEKEEFEAYNFTRTYHVNSITEDQSGYYYYLTVYAFQDVDDIEVVKVSKTILPNIEINKNYEFTFEINHEIDDDIEDIFKECKLISIKETDKVGLDQIQDPMKSY